MLKKSILLVTLFTLAALALACAGSPAAQQAVTAGPALAASPSPTFVPTATAMAAPGAPTKAPAPYPVVTAPAGGPAPAVPTAVAAQPTTPPAPPAATAAPSGPYPVLTDGLALMSERCTGCHNLTRIQSAKKSKAEWDAFVTQHKTKGIQLTDAETAILVDFLAANYK